MEIGSRPTNIPLGNDLDILFEDVLVRGEPDPTLALRGYVALTREDAEPIDPALEVEAEMVDEDGRRYRASIPGTAITEHLADYLHERVYIVGESVPPGSYREVFPVTVVEDQGP